jgi:hypothetical protein
MTVVRPLSNELIPVIRATNAITIAVVLFDVVVEVLCRPRMEASSLWALPSTVDRRRVRRVSAKTVCNVC